ncbi:hypothetical protein CEW46_29170 [Bacillus cereus]|nr:hypothetical protein CEW46_29170 [Bacillus cereus]
MSNNERIIVVVRPEDNIDVVLQYMSEHHSIDDTHIYLTPYEGIRLATSTISMADSYILSAAAYTYRSKSHKTPYWHYLPDVRIGTREELYEHKYYNDSYLGKSYKVIQLAVSERYLRERGGTNVK